MLIFSRFLSKNAGYYFHFFVIIDREAERGEAEGVERGEAEGAPSEGGRAQINIAVPQGSGHYVWLALRKPGCGFVRPGFSHIPEG